MKHNNLVKISISAALAAVLFAGCGSSTSPASLAEKSSTSTQSESKKSDTAQSLNTLSGTIRLDNTPVNSRTTHSLNSNVYSITAYNLNDNSVYKTTTNASGHYTLSGLSDGEYQIYAENNEVAKSAIKRVALARGTRKVVDFVLQAAGSIKGQIKGAEVVYIPGKDYVVIPDENGYFEMTNIPVGTYVLKYEIKTDSKYYDEYDDTKMGSLNITVQEGMTDLSLITPQLNLIKINSDLRFGTLQLHHDGIGIKYDDWMIDPKLLSQAAVLKDASGTVIPVEVGTHYEGFVKLRTKEIVPAGDYTLTIPATISDKMAHDFVRTFHVDAVAVAFTESDSGSSARYLRIDLPQAVSDTQKASLGTIVVKEKGSTATVSVKAVWTGDHQLALFGNYKTGVEYVFDLTDAQKALLGDVKTFFDKLTFGEAKLEGVYPANGLKEVAIDQPIYVNVQNVRELDPSTVKFTITNGSETKTYTQQDILFSRGGGALEPYDYMDIHSDYYNNFYTTAIGVKDAKLEYGKTYTVRVEAKDFFGHTLTSESTFQTLTPEVRDLSPNDLDELFRDNLRAEFNVAVKKGVGTITVEDLTDPSHNPEVKLGKRDRYDGYDEYEMDFMPQTIFFEIDGLMPEHKYKVTASGFESQDGVEIPAETTEFVTPPKMLIIPEEYSQNLFVDPQQFEHKVRFFVFGDLTDAEKAFMEAHLQVTSYGNAQTPDATHPARKLFFVDDHDGVEIVVAFTIDAGTNYEISFDDVSGLSGIVMPRGFEAGKPLVSFSTQKMTGTTSSQNGQIIQNLNVHNDGMEGRVELEATIPLGKIPSYESCWNRFGNDMESVDLSAYIHVVDEENKEVSVEFNRNSNYSMNSRYIGDEMQVCELKLYPWNTNAYFPADYDNTYIVSADFTKDFADSGYGALSLSKELKTAPIGQMDYWIDDNDGKDAIIFHVRANAPIANPEILKVVIDGEEYRPEVGGYASDSTQSSDTKESVSAPMMDGDIIFRLPRPLYSLVTFTLAKDDGTTLKFINPHTEEEVERADILATPKTFTEDVSPDFVPVKGESVHTLSTQNRFVVAEFNRMLRMDDIATYSDANKTQLSEVAFEVKDSSGTAVMITAVEYMDNAVGFELAEELNTSKTYTLSLKEGKTVQSAFGVQKLTSFSQPIDLTVIDVKEAYASSIRRAMDSEKPYMLGATESFDMPYVEFNYMAVPLDVAEGVTVDFDKSKVVVKSHYGNMFNVGALEIENNLLIQPLDGNAMYNDFIAEIELSYTYNGETKTFNRKMENIARQNVAELYSISGEGVNSLRFNFSMDPTSITEENFRVFNMDDTPATGVTLSVQVDTNNQNSAVVTFDGLAADTEYRVEVVGLSAYGNPGNPVASDTVAPDTMVSEVYIQTPAQ